VAGGEWLVRDAVLGPEWAEGSRVANTSVAMTSDVDDGGSGSSAMLVMSEVRSGLCRRNDG